VVDLEDRMSFHCKILVFLFEKKSWSYWLCFF
jgi:hypothetical protein